ncbi:hypothetical protein Glove_672g2 [Diversispora epigaea]|uniref:Reverse transcriptase domain-containing protein n=1 Tax=Diversispora epigaea TaxID=1348612 RepID=A0A397G3D8_9GLOM|nr:hypothetical protein Glove_672g2 [Diversispora epigaea]
MEYNELEWECSLLRRNIIQEWVQYLRDPMSYSILPRPLQWVSTLSSSNHPPTWSENSSVDSKDPLYNTLKDLNKIGKLGSQIIFDKTTVKSSKTKEDKIRDIIKRIEIILNKQPDLLQKFPEHESQEGKETWYKNTKEILNSTCKLVKTEAKKEQRGYIAKCIEKRQRYLHECPKQMINSVFETGHKRIVLDRIVEKLSNGKINIITNPEEHIDEKIYDGVTQIITLEEVSNHVRISSNNKAPGPSGIPYEVFKHLGPSAIEWIAKFFNDILRTGQTPRDWSHANVTLIPKPKDWEEQLEITKPI